MAFVSEMFDQLRDLLNDASDTQVTYATKKLYINRGIARLWPKINRITSEVIALTAATQIYTLTSAASDGLLVSVEKNDQGDDDSYVRFSGYDLIPGDHAATGYIRITDAVADGDELRITYVRPIAYVVASTYAAAQSETWTGPDRALQLPVFYAASLISLRKIDDRQDTNRYSTTQAQNGVSDQDIMGSAQLWMGQFELELGLLERPLYPAVD